MFCNFCEKFENSKWPPFLARHKFFENWDGYSTEIPCGSKISSKSLNLAQFSRYKHFCVLTFLASHKVFENWDGSSSEIPCGSKIPLKLLYHGFRDISIFVFCNFCEKFENSKWPPFWRDKNFFENWYSYSADIACGSKISSNSHYLARFSRYKHFYVLQFLRKNLKIQNGHHFCRDKYFLKIGMTTLKRYPVGQKFRRNPSI